MGNKKYYKVVGRDMEDTLYLHFKFEVDKKYKINGNERLTVGANGFTFIDNPYSIYMYNYLHTDLSYKETPHMSGKNRVFEVEVNEKYMIHNEQLDAYCTSEIRLTKEIDIHKWFSESCVNYYKNRDIKVVRRVAGNQNTTSDILNKLSNCEDELIREMVAENKNTSQETLLALSLDDSCTVRERVALNKNCPSSALERLSYDKDVDVLFSVAINKNTPNYILLSMIKKGSAGYLLKEQAKKTMREKNGIENISDLKLISEVTEK